MTETKKYIPYSIFDYDDIKSIVKDHLRDTKLDADEATKHIYDKVSSEFTKEALCEVKVLASEYYGEIVEEQLKPYIAYKSLKQ